MNASSTATRPTSVFVEGTQPASSADSVALELRELVFAVGGGPGQAVKGPSSRLLLGGSNS
eukprot:CAMPEP_0115146936 /NCGR_PEP_ID=MMETSP0227-20121206/63004_1 /TAXON_ID=89957 /ORGANISM="Polarella glacialis, Strain CCMP 1383" /LENGTH=60 /DNA_ID=CAMNT_0002556733 /DNA_START=15 /DNA_END=193 /DNA_ORIENTATION=+